MARINNKNKVSDKTEETPAKEAATMKVRSVYGRMVDLTTNAVYTVDEFVEVAELTPFMQAQLEAGKISVEW